MICLLGDFDNSLFKMPPSLDLNLETKRLNDLNIKTKNNFKEKKWKVTIASVTNERHWFYFILLSLKEGRERGKRGKSRLPWLHIFKILLILNMTSCRPSFLDKRVIMTWEEP